MVEHAIAEPKQWRPLPRWTGDRDDLPEVITAIGALVSDQGRIAPDPPQAGHRIHPRQLDGLLSNSEAELPPWHAPIPIVKLLIRPAMMRADGGKCPPIPPAGAGQAVPALELDETALTMVTAGSAC
jgi:hypothetical protein